MRILINERLSEHKYKTPEGYLICTDAIIARTGKQEYRKNEIFADSDDDSIIELDRPADEVFSEKTIASFENKPLVNEHPDEDVNTENHKDYAVGFIRDVHKGTVDGQDVLLANLVFTDKDAIDDIESGRKKELSCGYDCDIVDEKNPKQTNIRGNHVALCERGRAGIAKIVDSINDGPRRVNECSHGYAIVEQRSWNKYHEYSYIETWRDNLEEARYVKNSLIKNDRIWYVIINCNETPKRVIDSINDVEPKAGESKEDFISRFMSETKEEYPDEKQRLAVAYSYWKKGKDSMKDSLTRQERELCDYMLENAYEKGMTAERLWRKMVVYYSEYASLARSKKEDVLDYFEEEIENSMYDSTPYEKVQDSMIKDCAVEVLHEDGTYYKTVKVDYDGRYDSETILKEFYKKHPEFKSDRYKVQIAQDSTYDETPYEKQTTELEKSEERFEDGGFQEIGDFWRNLARKNKISSQQMDDLYVKFMNTPVFQSWSNKDRMDIAYSERMFGEFEKFFKQKTGKDLIVDSVKDAWVKTYRKYSYWPDEEEANLYHVEKRENGKLIKSFTIEASTYNEALQQIKSFKDSLSYSDIDVIEDAIYWVKKSGKDLTVKNVLKQIKEDMSGFIGSNKNDVINYLKREKHLRDASSKQEESLYNLLKANCNLESKVSGGEKWRYKGNDFDSFFNKLKSIAPDLVAKSSLMKGLILVKRPKTYDSVKDAQTYVIKYKDLRYNTLDKREFKANSVEEALKKFARQIALEGIGTYNVFVGSISPNDGYISLYGRLSKLLDEFNITDSVKDSKINKAIKAIKAIKQHQDSKLKDDYSGFLGNYGFGYLKGSGDYEYWYYKDKNDINTFNRVVERIRKEYPRFIVSSIKSDGNPRIYIQKSKYGVKDSKVQDDEGKVEIINGTKYASGPRGKVKISTLKRSDAENQGYGYHHTIFTPEGRYDVMIKNNSAIAVINEE